MATVSIRLWPLTHPQPALTAPGEAWRPKACCTGLWHCPCILLLSARSTPPFSHPFSFLLLSLTLLHTLSLLELAFLKPISQIIQHKENPLKNLACYFRSVQSTSRFPNFIVTNTWHTVRDLTKCCPIVFMYASTSKEGENHGEKYFLQFQK